MTGVTETYFVTGASGLVGNHVLRALVDRGIPSAHIVGYDLNPSPANIAAIADDITLIEGDVTDAAELFAAFEAYRPTRVIHLAALLVYDAWEDPDPVISVNCLGTNAVFEAARVYGVDRCVYASTAGVYGTVADYGGDAGHVVSEDDPVKPTDAYSASKVMNEVVASDFDERYDTEYVGVRLGGVWGRGRLTGSTGEFTSFVREVGLGTSRSVPEAWVDIFGATGDIYASYGKDVGRWLVELADTAALKHALYNQRNREPFTLAEVATILEDRLPKVSVSVPTDGPAGAPPPILDATRWYDELQLEQAWDIEDALVDFVNYHRGQADLAQI